MCAGAVHVSVCAAVDRMPCQPASAFPIAQGGFCQLTCGLCLPPLEGPATVAPLTEVSFGHSWVLRLPTRVPDLCLAQ